MQEALMQQGLDITLFGMGIVFTFLLLLVICTTIMSRVMTRFFPEAEAAAVRSSAPAASSAAGNARLRKIIEEAVKQHRNRRK
ncbi:OadG family protein [Microbulbifer agarilyticus]|uniref:OadG family protein n=1 Tax=Microbulbifer agarilyticus TaxID=260552 RepID=UPI001CD5D8CF|nr:OadG family protein [Microbulbifer agarilyticus]MCA0901224.1 OadG family protein [Microbulbifer agarilyticus]